MTSISYEKIFNHFLGLVEDNKFWTESQDDINEILTELLHKAIYSSYIYHLFTTIFTEDSVQLLTFEIKHKIDEELDTNFIIVAIAKWMKYEWLSPQLNSVVLTSQFFGGKEQSAYSQANHMKELRELTELAYKEARDFIRDRNYINNNYLSNGGLS